MPGRNRLHVLFHLLASRLILGLSSQNITVSKKKMRTRSCGKKLKHMHHMRYVTVLDDASRSCELIL
jgi:hypothetical protein